MLFFPHAVELHVRLAGGIGNIQKLGRKPRKPEPDSEPRKVRPRAPGLERHVPVAGDFQPRFVAHAFGALLRMQPGAAMIDRPAGMADAQAPDVVAHGLGVHGEGFLADPVRIPVESIREKEVMRAEVLVEEIQVFPRRFAMANGFYR